MTRSAYVQVRVRCRCAVERAPSTLRRLNLSRNVKLDSKLRLRRIEFSSTNGASPQPDEACGSHVMLLGAPVGQDDP